MVVGAYFVSREEERNCRSLGLNLARPCGTIRRAAIKKSQPGMAAAQRLGRLAVCAFSKKSWTDGWLGTKPGDYVLAFALP
jgi:hypothetical protein